LKHFIVIVCAFAFAACASWQAPGKYHVSKTAGETREASILFIGNSYSFDVPKELRRNAADDRMKLRVSQVTHGGWTLKQHTENEETLNAIRKGGWDYVVIQEQSRIPSQTFRRARAMYPHVRTLAHEARKVGAKPVLYQTWGRRDGDDWHFGKDDFHEMNRRLREGYRQAAQAAGGLTIVPVGDVWEKEVDAGRGNELFEADGSHPSKRGNELTAQVFYETLFRPGS
jgi:hypothetical protein